jgi:galactonate dehydratase
MKEGFIIGNLKITGYKTYVLGTPWRNITYVVLETDDGITGVGEARVVGRTHTVLELLKDTQRHFIGHSAYDTEAMYQRFVRDDFNLPGGEDITAFSLLEMACLDCQGKKAGIPVYKLLGGKVRDKIPAYANGWYTVEREPEAFKDSALKVIQKGYMGLKFDPFGNGDLELTRKEYIKSIGLIEAVASVLPDYMQVFVEMHGRFAPHQAIEIAKDIEKLKPGWIEEPCRADDLGAHALVMAHTNIPIATGERLYTPSEYRELFERRSANIIQVDPTNFGVLEAKRLAFMAEAYSMVIAPHNVGGVISTLAGIHLMGSLRNGKILEHFNNFADSEVKNAGTWYPELIDGHFTLPDKPGWGVELNIDFIESRPPQIKDGVILDPGLNMFGKSDWQKRGQDKR